MVKVTLFIILATHLCSVENYNILGIFLTPGKSHMMMWKTLMEELAARGHEVDVLSNFPQEKPISRYTDLNTQEMETYYSKRITMDYLKKNFNNKINAVNHVLTKGGIFICEEFYNSSRGKALKNSEKKYDLLITHILGTDCMLGFAHHFKIPVVGIISSVNLPWTSDRIGNPDNPSYIPIYFSSYGSSMTFIERLSNTLNLLAIKIGYHFISYTRSNELAREFFGDELPDLRELVHNTSLLLVNSHFSINQARPVVPNFIEVGGLHIKPPKPLSARLEKHLELTSKYKGVIYFSTGSLILSETLSENILTAFFEAFNEMPYKVIWEANEEGLPKNLVVPSNIHFEEWLPQLDILCHPNVKLFVTHGGMFSIQEAAYCGIPQLGIPLISDQAMNFKSLVALGVAIILELEEVTKETILNASKTLLEEPRYRENTLKVAEKFKDRPLSALDTAVYWVEYVMRYEGAPHLRSEGANLPWYQYYLLDVGLFLFAFTAMFLGLIYYLCVLFLRMLLGSKPITKPKSD